MNWGVGGQDHSVHSRDSHPDHLALGGEMSPQHEAGVGVSQDRKLPISGGL